MLSQRPTEQNHSPPHCKHAVSPHNHPHSAIPPPSPAPSPHPQLPAAASTPPNTSTQTTAVPARSSAPSQAILTDHNAPVRSHSRSPPPPANPRRQQAETLSGPPPPQAAFPFPFLSLLAQAALPPLPGPPLARQRLPAAHGGHSPTAAVRSDAAKELRRRSTPTAASGVSTSRTCAPPALTPPLSLCACATLALAPPRSLCACALRPPEAPSLRGVCRAA